MVTATAIAAPEPGLADYGPGIGAALSFSAADVLSKVVFASGMDVLSLITLRGILAAGFFFVWLRASPPRVPHTPRARAISIGLGALYAANIFGLLFAIQVMPLSIAILAYFVYPLLTGIAAAALGLERLGWRSLVTALVAFGGLALMLGTQPGTVAPIGLLAAHRCARDDVVLAGAGGAGVHRGVAGHRHIPSAADCRRVGGIFWHGRHHHAVHAVDLCLDRAGRRVSHRAGDESRTGAVVAVQLRAAGRDGDRPAAVRRRCDGGSAVRL